MELMNMTYFMSPTPSTNLSPTRKRTCRNRSIGSAYMRQSQNVDVLIVSNRYDHLGRRAQKITPEATYTYFYDGWLLVKEVVERSGDTRRCGVSPRHCGGAGSSTSLGEDAAGSRVSMEGGGVALERAFLQSKGVVGYNKKKN